MTSSLLLVAEVLLASVAVAVAAAAFYIYQIKAKYRHLPGPKETSFWFGNVEEVRAYVREEDQFLTSLLNEWCGTYGITYAFRILHRVVVFTADPGAVKEVLITGGHPKPSVIYNAIAKIYGNRALGVGLATSTNHTIWAAHRAVMNPAFHRKVLRDFMATFNSTGDKLTAKLSGLADGKTDVYMCDVLQRAAHDVLAKVAFGKDVDALGNEHSPFPNALTKVMQGSADEISQLFAMEGKFSSGSGKQEVLDCLAFLRQQGQAWLRERRARIQKGDEVPEDILTLIVRDQENNPGNMDMETAVDNILTFFVAGQETTANTLGFVLRELGRRPDIKEKLCQEIDEVLEQREHIEFEEVSKLTYTTMVIKEALRLHPPVPFTFRELNQDTTIDGYRVPKGTLVGMASYVSARAPAFNPNALEFKPERFLPHADDRPKMYTQLPFGLGPRACIGQNFAMIEAKVFLAKFFQKLDFKLDPNDEFKTFEQTSLSPKGRVKCVLFPRQIEC